MAGKSSFDYVLDNGICLGCAACTQMSCGRKISVNLDRAGFIRPTLSEGLTVAEDRDFSLVCPGLSVQHTHKDERWTELWGPVMSSHVGWAVDPQVRREGSSGGGITAAICFLLDNDYVDAVLQVGASIDDPLINTYRISTTSEQARENSGSRYAPAAPLAGLRAALATHSRVALVGKPCDIVAARNLATLYHDIAIKLRYYISFMCAGVPSTHGTDAVLKHLNVKREDVRSFRYRGNGWPGFATATLSSGESRQMSYQESWGAILNKHLQLRCKVCIDGTGEFADITFADAWHGNEKGYPDFEERDGRSLVLVRTEVGKALLHGAVERGYIEIKPLALAEVEKMQPFQAIRKKLMFSRILAMKLLGLKPPRYDFKNMFKLAVRAGVKANIVSFLGMARRAYAIKKMAPGEASRRGV